MNKLDEALKSAETAVKLAPREPSAVTQLCGVHLQLKQHGQALTCYENLSKLEALDPMARTYYGVALLGVDRTFDARAVLEKAAEALPSSGITLNALGFAYFKEKRFPEAVSMFKRAVELEPDQAEMRFNLAIAQLASGNKEGAISQYRILKDSNAKLAKQLYQILFRNSVVSVDELTQR
jgi:Flp pilus assembly protein TadD